MQLKSRTFTLKNISVKRIAVLGMLLALFIAIKYAFAFIPGVEGVSFLFITCALFLPFVDLALLIICFNFLVLTTTGFGTWWIAYWVLWPLIAFTSKLLSYITKNRYVFSLLGFVSGLLVMFVYFLSDIIFFDTSFATLNLISALPINLIEGLITMILIILLTPRILRIIKGIGGSFWERDYYFVFKETKHNLFNIIVSILLVIISTAGTIMLFIFNSFFLKLKEEASRIQMHSGHIIENKVPKGWNALQENNYNNFFDSLADNQIGIAIIANNNIIQEAIDIYSGEILDDALTKAHTFSFARTSTQLGNFIGSYIYKGQTLHGTSSSKAYGDYYPMILQNHEYMNLGVSNIHIQAKDIYEFTYDHNA